MIKRFRFHAIKKKNEMIGPQQAIEV